MNMRVGSLFSGIGGFDLAAEWMGWRTAWFSEIEPYAASILAKHWPDTPNHGDITKIRGAQVEPVDLLVGGFPCQDISLAGKGAGIEGERSGLWSHYARLIDELRPRWVVAENVSALKNRGLYRVLQDLHALGYDAEWHCIPASAVGAPHQRDRIWIVAYPHADDAGLEGRDGTFAHERAGERPARPMGSQESSAVADAKSDGRGEERQNTERGSSSRGQTERDHRRGSARGRAVAPAVPDTHSELEHQRQRGSRTQGGRASSSTRSVDPLDEDLRAGVSRRAHGRRAAHDADSGRHRSQEEEEVRSGWLGPLSPSWWEAEPDVGRVVDGLSTRLDRAIHRGRLKCLGNALVPLIPYIIYTQIKRAEEGIFVPPLLSSGDYL